MRKKIIGFTLLVLFLASVPLLTLHFKYTILDWWQLRGYTPSNEISSLADTTTMTQYSQRLFYVHKPEIDEKTTFTGRCSSAEQTIVLGCYRRGEGIYILRVTDERLSGAMEVTAAHEMLHAAYDRLSSGDKQQVNAWLDATRANLTSERIKNTLKGYEDRDAASIYTEMHSIFGTELRNMSPELENYYAQFFADRSAVVAISERYEAVFTDMRAKVETYDADLALRKKSIEVQETAIQDMSAQLADQKSVMDRNLAQNNRAAYNAAVPSYNSLVRQYNDMVARLQTDIADYNKLVEDRNAVALEQQALVKELDATKQVEAQ